MDTRFRDRTQAGRQLAAALEEYRRMPVVVYALPRGGVVLGAEVARHLEAPLDVVIPRKIGHPFNPEYAIAAITEGGTLVCDQQEIDTIDIEWLKSAIMAERAEARRRRERYQAGRQPVPAAGKTAILVDDGVATGLTMLAAIQEVSDLRPSTVVVAVPVLPDDVARLLGNYADKIVYLAMPEAYLGSVGAYYDQFEQVSDNTVVELLQSVPPLP